MKTKQIALSGVLLGVLAGLVGCGGNDNKQSNSSKPGNSSVPSGSISTNNPNQKYDNDTTPLVLSTQELDGVFNPFFSTSGTDSSIVGMTQLGMLSTDKDGNIAYGEDQPSVVLDYEQKTEGTGDDQTTTYTFVLKNNILFSDGKPLTMKDVLFNLYLYLDPVYTGSATMYSTEIVGLKEYRTQSDNENEQDSFEETFQSAAQERIDNLCYVIAEINKEAGGQTNISNVDTLKTALQNKEGEYKGIFDYADKFVEDFEKAGEEFKKELNTDFNNNMGTAEDLGLANDVEAFLYVEGYITIDYDKDVNDPERIDYALGKEFGLTATREEAIDAVYNAIYPADVETILQYYMTSTTLKVEFSAEAKENYFKNTSMVYKNIEGIKVCQGDVKIGDKTYPKATLDSTGKPTSGYEALTITIEGVDPKAIWNFAFSVSPMHYYSSQKEIERFDYVEHFGVEYGSMEFMNNVVKDNDKIGLPVGAGPYQVSNMDGETMKNAKIEARDFWKDNVVYFHRNDNFLLGAPKIRLVRYQVFPQETILDSLFQGQVHYCEPSAKQEIIKNLNDNANNGFGYSSTKTLGYGYIGINPTYVENIYVRRAIMHAMNTELTTEYYPGTAEVIYRPMSKVSWAYPDGATPYYEYDATGQTSLQLFEKAGYRVKKTSDKKNVLVDSKGKQFELKFTIAGESSDHPAFNTMNKAAEILNRIGCKITVVNDTNALSKLNSGSLAVWAAAWSSTIDPDMYQVYHKDSTATSTLNWGYDTIENNENRFPTETAIIDELSDLIEQGRSTLVQETRKAIYAEALDLVMELAVELPTYQRDDLFAYNTKVLNVNSMTPKAEISPYNGPMSKLWEVSFN